MGVNGRLVATLVYLLAFGAVKAFAFAPPLRLQGHPIGLDVRQLEPKGNIQTWPYRSVTPITSQPYDKGEAEGESQGLGEEFGAFLHSLWAGVTVPFPALRRVLLMRRSNIEDKSKIALGLTVREAFLFLLAYLVTGVISYSYLLEKWSIIDSLYFSCVCFSTVGYGDLGPTSRASKLFTCFFALGGVAFLGTAVVTVGSSVMAAEIDTVKKARRLSRKRIMKIFEGMPGALQKYRRTKKKPKNYIEALELKVDKDPLRKRIAATIGKAIPTLGTILVGATIMSYLNGGTWTLLDSMYYGLITASTIGFGDICPQTQAAKLWAVIFIPLSVAAAGELLSSVALSLIKRRQREMYEQQLKKDFTLEHLQAMDSDGDDQITREEYVHFMLIEMGLVSKQELKELYEQFDRLDITQNGFLDTEDLRLMAMLRGAQVAE